jgi:hypothetical protein
MDTDTLTVSGNVVTGNLKTNNLLYANGTAWSFSGGNSTYSNSNVANYLVTYTGNINANIVVATILSGNHNGNGSGLTSIPGANVTGYVPNATNANSATTAGTVTTNAQPNITSVGTLTGLTVTATISGNITGNANYANTTGSATTAATVTTNAQPNITSLGTLTSVIASGNVTLQSNAQLSISNTTESTTTTTGALRVVGGIASQGNIHANHIHAFNSLNAGQHLFAGNNAQGSSFQSQVIVGKDTATAYVQSAMVNSADTGSADWIAYGESGDDEQGWNDFGYTGTNFNDANYTITKASDGYIFTQGMSGQGGNLVLATGDIGAVSYRDIVFATGGFANTNEKLRISHASNTVMPYSNATMHLGNSTRYFANMFVSNITVSSSIISPTLVTAGGSSLFQRSLLDTGLNVRGDPLGGSIFIYGYGSDGNGTGASEIDLVSTSNRVDIYSEWGTANQSKWSFRNVDDGSGGKFGIFETPDISIGSVGNNDQITSNDDTHNILVGNKDLSSFIMIGGPDASGTDGVYPIKNTVKIHSNAAFGEGPGLILFKAGDDFASPNAVAKLEMGDIADKNHSFPPTGNAVLELTSTISMYGGLVSYGDITIPAGHSLGIRSNIIFQDGSIQNTAYTGSGSANTGNVTFNDINIIGTGNLRLQPDETDSDAYLDIYLTSGPDIHIAGNGETVILGTDDFANVTVNVDGNVSIQAGDANGTHTWKFETDGNITIPGDIIGTSTINIDNRASGNSADINLYAADDITIQGRDRGAGSSSEGGDINIFAGNSAVDSDSSGGDIQIYAGNGGNANVDYSGQGGFITIASGRGGNASTGVGNYPAEDGGELTLRAGNAGNNNGNIDRGADGGFVYIEAGDSTGNTIDGGGIALTTGLGGANALAGNVEINIPSSDLGAGGTWIFDGYGNLTLPGSIVTPNGVTAVIGYTTGTAGAPLTITAGDGGSAATGWNGGEGGNLTIAAGDAGSDIGNPSWGNTGGTLVLRGGNSTQPYHGSDVQIHSGNSVASPGLISLHTGTNQWTFDKNGTTTLPNNAIIIAPNTNDLTLRVTGEYNICTIQTAGSGYSGSITLPTTTTGGNGSGMTVNFGYGISGQLTSVSVSDPGTGYSNGDIIGVDGGSGTFVLTNYNPAVNGVAPNNNTAPADWIFDTNGNIILPTNYSSINYANGTSILSGLSGGANTGDFTFSTNTMSLTPGDDMVISLDDEAEDGYVLEQNVTMGVGNVSTRTRLGTSDFTIETDVLGVGHQFSFNSDGSFDVPGNITTFDVNIALIAMDAGSHPTASLKSVSNVNDPNVFSTFDATPTGANIKVYDGGSSGGTEYAWQFGDDGSLTTPSSLVIGSRSGGGSLLQQNDAALDIIGEGSSAGVQLGWAANLTAPDNVALIAMNYPGGGEGNVLIAVGNNATTVNYWLFDNTGNLTLPTGGALTTTGNVTGNFFIGNGSQLTGIVAAAGSNIANGNSNVSIATANGNVTITAVGNTTMTVTGTGANITGTLNATGNISGANISATGTLTSTGKIGYASGSTVTQTSNRGNGVNINALAGTIITVSASMVADEISVFSVTNNQVDTNNDIVLVQVVSPNLGNYNVIANPNSGIGGFYLTLQNISGFSISAEAVTIRFMVIKAPNA